MDSISPAYGTIGDAGQPLTFYGENLLSSDGSLPTYTNSDRNITLQILSSDPVSGSSSSNTTLYAKYTIAATDTPTGEIIDLFTDAGVSNDTTFTSGYPDAGNIVVTPSTWPAGQTTAITITGSNLGTAPSAYVTPSDITYNQTGASSSSITATVTVPSTETATQALVYVTPGNTGCSGFCYQSGDPGDPSGQAPPATVAITPAIPHVSFSNVSDIPQGGNISINASVTDAQGNPLSSNNIPIHITLSATGTGSAAFANGTTDMTITASGSYRVNGVAASGASGNISIGAVVHASDSQGALTANQSVANSSPTLTVVTIALSLQTAGAIASDNSAVPQFLFNIGTSTLGSITYSYTANGTPGSSCAEAYQITGNVTPSDYAGQISLRRSVSYALFYGTTSGPSGAGDDTSNALLLDSFPQSGGSTGKVYDLDAPGPEMASTLPAGTVYRLRSNFQEYAVLGANTSTTILSQSNLVFTQRSPASCRPAGPLLLLAPSRATTRRHSEQSR